MNLPEKRLQLLLTMQRNKTNFRTESTPKLQNLYYPTAYHSTNLESKSKGVTILLAKHCPFQVTDTLIDDKGNFLFLKGTCKGRRLTLANLYAPYTGRVSFFREIVQLLTGFQDGTLILGGDFNVPLNPLLDTSNGISSLPYSALRAIKTQLQTLLLHDTWRILFPDGKDYTFFSTPHNKYSRIVYLFISQNDLPILQRACIDPMFLSDHHSISIHIAFPETYSRSRSWKLDPCLLTNPSMAVEVERGIK